MDHQICPACGSKDIECKCSLLEKIENMTSLLEKCGWWLSFAEDVSANIRGESKKFATDAANCCKANHEAFKKELKKIKV